MLLFALTIFGQEEIWMRPNLGQWHENVEYKIGIPGGEMFLEGDGITYLFHSFGDVYDEAHAGHDHHHEEKDVPTQVQAHSLRAKFIGANPSVGFDHRGESPFYENYILGNDPSKWVSELRAYEEVEYMNLYDGINLQLYRSNGTLKYDVLINAGSDPSQFRVQYEGQDDIRIRNEELIVITRLATITESKPIAYQWDGGIKRNVPCRFKLKGDVVTFEFPEGYDPDLDLVIDPELAFSSYTGSTADNWGMTACPDVDKKMIGAGIVFSSGYPTVSAFMPSYNGGDLDVALSKWTEDGSGLVYSTYIGGAGSESPHSIIVNEANELFMLGITSSGDFPMGSAPYDGTYAGGTAFTYSGLNFFGGSDLFVFKLNAAGTFPLGSTFYGGTANDGYSSSANVRFNYGDGLRGEIMVDEASNVYITSSTSSSDIPIVGGFDNTLGGSQDAIVAKFNSGLSSLLWSTYIGGTAGESGNSVQVASDGDIYVGGGTTSSNLPNTGAGVNPSYQGGITDGYVYKFNAPSYGSPVGTYIGTSDYDQTYFVQLDADDDVYLYGQTRGSYPITPGLYGNPNSGQFLHKLSNDLSTTEWTSTFGASSGNEELSPTAFLVSDCYKIYIAGWGGVTNSTGPASNSSSSGMPIPDPGEAYQSVTDGSDFYLAVFSPNMADIEYATYLGNTTGTGSGDHVDGGTSRFDKEGGVYHAVCAACGGGDWPTTPGAWSEVNGAASDNRCNMAVFLFELSKIEATLSAASPVVCIPDPVNFINDSENGNAYFWDFGDGSGTSTAFAPSYAYTDPGIYTVMLVVFDTSGCFEPDTAYIEVEIQLAEAQAGSLTDTICPGQTVELWAIGGDSYSWGPADLLDDPSSANPIATINEETTFTVTVESACGTSEVEVTVYVFETSGSAGGDTAICVGGSAEIFATGGGTYSWSPATTLDDPSSATPLATPLTTTYYQVDITTEEGCLIEDTVLVWVDQDIPYPNLIDEVKLCKGNSIQIYAGGATDYLWEPDYNISDVNIYNPTVWPTVDTSYAVTFTNACGSSYDTVDVDVIEIIATASPDTTVCPGDPVNLWASGGDFYSWEPSAAIQEPNDSITTARPWSPTVYTVVVSDVNGCFDIEEVYVLTYPQPAITVSPNVYAMQGDTAEIYAEGDGFITWAPPYNISCTNCPSAFVWPEIEQTYVATLTDENSCTVSAPVTIFFDPLIYVPNAFSPNGDGMNDFFKAVASNIRNFEMLIFNRWGEVVWEGDNTEDFWDGRIRPTGIMAKDDAYVWQIRYEDLRGNKEVLRGHVILLK